MSAILQTRNLITNFYTYEGVVKALNNVSITVRRGETFGLVGESGCGKSVTVRSIMRVISAPGKIEGGQVLFFRDEAKPDEAEDLLQKNEADMQALRGDTISMIFQEPNAALNPVMTVGEQVAESFLFHRTASLARDAVARMQDEPGAYGLSGRLFKSFLQKAAGQDPRLPMLKIADRLPLLRRWRKPLLAEALKRSVKIIGQLGIANPEEIIGRYPHQLSGGMKQRIVIAIALACQPDLLIADEATSNLDVTIQAQILDLLHQLKKTTIQSILLITHDLGVVAETCDRVGVMYAGTVCEVAPVRALFEKPLHPYSAALLNSVPKLHQKGELAAIEGSVPNLVTPPTGCRFHPRCDKALEICLQKNPELKRMAQDHFVACHLY